jgi:flagella basal body P-ring formation protein FlgA
MKTRKHIITLVCIALLIAVAANQAIAQSALNRIQTAVKEDLAKSISDRAVLEEVKIVKGAEYLGAGSYDLTISNLRMEGYSGRNTVLYEIYLRDRNSRTVNVTAEVSYDMLADVFVTARPLAKGDVISKADYYTVKQKLSKLPAGAITDKKDIEGKTIKAGLTDGVVLRTALLQSALTARRGKKVNLVIEGSSVVVSAKGTLRSDATVGEAASVTCDVTRKVVHGVLVTPDLVKVKI